MKYSLLISQTIQFGLLLLCSVSIRAQDSGALQILVTPSSTQVRILEKVYDLQQDNVIRLPAGRHLGEYWAPTFMVHRDTVNVLTDSLIVVAKGLSRVNPEYEKYLDLTNTRFRQQFSTYGQGVGFALSGGLAASQVYTKPSALNTTRQRALNLLNQYQASLSTEELESLARQYQIESDDYEELRSRHNTNQIIGTGAIVMGTLAGVWYLMKRTKKTEAKPSYNEQNPFSNSVGISPKFGYDDQQFISGFVLNF